jgi:hypothetical protein
MIIKNIDNKKIIIAYDQWNGDLSPDNYYILAEIDFFDNYIKISSFSGKRVYKQEEDDCFLTSMHYYNDHKKRSSTTLYFSTYLFVEKIVEKIVDYDLACLPYKKRFSYEYQQKSRKKRLARVMYKRIEKIYNQILETINPLYRMDQLEKKFYAINGKTTFLDFINVLSSVKFFPDEFLRKDILKYRGAGYAFMSAVVGAQHTFKNKCVSLPRSKTLIIDSSLWNWRDFLCDMYEQRTPLTNKFLDNFPGGVPIRIGLQWNTTHEPDRRYLLTHRAIRTFFGSSVSETVKNIIERSTNEQIHSAIAISGGRPVRKTEDILHAITHIFTIQPPSEDCTLAGWAKHAVREHRRQEERTIEETMKEYENVDILAPEFPVVFDKNQIKQLRTPKEIVVEGSQMKHCVSRYVPKALSGKSYLFSILHADERATAEINSEGDVIQVKGPRNSNNKAVSYAKSIIITKIEELKKDNKLVLPKPNEDIYKFLTSRRNSRTVRPRDDGLAVIPF